jgi:chromatin modification-related protein VID21
MLIACLFRGRYFNEATLPPPAHLRARSPNRNVSTVSKPADAVSPIDIPHATEPQQRATPALTQSGDATPNLQPTPADATGPRQPSVQPSPKLQLGVPLSAVQSPSSPRVDRNGSVPISETLLNTDHEGTQMISPRVSKSAAAGVPSLEIPLNPRKKHEKRPSLTLGPSHEHPPSPASSIDPYNNNTPAPIAASPDTSPAEEAIEDAGAIDRSRYKHDRPAHPRSSLVPSTPDEQLRHEEVQSTQDKPANGVSDLAQSKETEESVDQVDDADRMDIDQEPAPDRSEEKSQGENAPTVRELISPTAPIEASADSTFETPVKKSVSIPSTQPGSAQPERMTTRVSSGALRHKSVSEILGETPKSHDKSHLASSSEQGSPDSVARMRFKDRKEREKERSRLSTVVFPKQPASQQDKADSGDLTHRDTDAVAKLNEEQDYLFTLFLNRAYAPPRGTNLNTLLSSAHKTLSTGNHLLEYQEQMDVRTLRRIYALQNANRWPLRQLKRSVEPPRQGTHWDVVIDHAKWMRTDFREERKWKIAAAKSCADWCAEYVHSDEEHQSVLRVQVKIPTPSLTEKDASKGAPSPPSEDTGDETFGGVSHPTPDLVPSAEEESISDSFNDEPRHELHDTVAPAAIFSLGLDEFNFSVDMTPAAEKLLDELPIYGPLQIAPGTNLPAFKAPPDSIWKADLLPVSKFASTKISFHNDARPRKRSRYDFSQYGNETDHRITELAPEQTNVALFRPENKPIRDRIHPGHSFRPPTEYPMPSVGFFESRSSSQWTYAEDDELRRLVKEYSYNWSLISSCLTPSSLFTSGAERRTPWECFERWVGLEGLPADMSKTQYFRAYHQRLETAQRTVLAQQQAAQQQQQQQQQQQGANAQPQPPVRRRTTQPLRVDRRRSSKHLALLDAMRKLAKKRETMLQKQQHGMFGIDMGILRYKDSTDIPFLASHLASLRKANEANQPKPPISSPAEFSRLKYDREMKLQERQEQYRQQMIAQQRVSVPSSLVTTL